MAMNKAEKAALEDAKTQAALRWTAPVEPDVPAPSYNSKPGIAEGYHYNSYSLAVPKMWSTSLYHGQGERSKYGGSQGSRSLYSTKLLALRAMRHSIECECAKKLRDIDRLIEAEAAAAKEKPDTISLIDRLENALAATKREEEGHE